MVFCSVGSYRSQKLSEAQFAARPKLAPDRSSGASWQIVSGSGSLRYGICAEADGRQKLAPVHDYASWESYEVF